MTPNRPSRLGQGLRFGFCVVLLLWIFHVIFCNEAQLHLAETGGNWSALSKMDQRRLAWTRGPVELWRMARRTSPAAAALAITQCGVLIVLGALRWRYVMHVQGIELPVRESIRISLVAHFFNALLLGATGGDVVKAWYAAHATHHKKAEAVVTVFVDRLIGIFSLLLVAVVMMPVNASLLLRYKRYAGCSLVIAGMMAAAATAVLVGFHTDLLGQQGTIARFVSRLPGGASLVRALAACRLFGRHRGFLPVTLAVSLLVNLLTIGVFAVLADGMGLSVPAMVMALVVPMVVCLASLPLAPAGLGIRENLFVYLLATPVLPVKHGEALAVSLLAYTANLVWSLVGGLVYLLMPNRPKLSEVEAE